MAAKNDKNSSKNMQKRINAPIITSNVNLYILDYTHSYLRIGLKDYKVNMTTETGERKENENKGDEWSLSLVAFTSGEESKALKYG